MMSQYKDEFGALHLSNNPPNQAAKLLSDEKRQVISFILMDSDQRRIYLQAVKADPRTSGALIAVLQYLMTS